MHFCWRTVASGTFTAWQRLALRNGTAYSITIVNITSDTRHLPKLIGFSHSYSSIITSSEEFWFELSNTLNNNTQYTIHENLTVTTYESTQNVTVD